MDVGDDLRLGDRQQVVVALEVLTPVGEPGPAVVGLGELVALDEGAHRAVQDLSLIHISEPTRPY